MYCTIGGDYMESIHITRTLYTACSVSINNLIKIWAFPTIFFLRNDIILYLSTFLIHAQIHVYLGCFILLMGSTEEMEHINHLKFLYSSLFCLFISNSSPFFPCPCFLYTFATKCHSYLFYFPQYRFSSCSFPLALAFSK